MRGGHGLRGHQGPRTVSVTLKEMGGRWGSGEEGGVAGWLPGASPWFLARGHGRSRVRNRCLPLPLQPALWFSPWPGRGHPGRRLEKRVPLASCLRCSGSPSLLTTVDTFVAWVSTFTVFSAYFLTVKSLSKRSCKRSFMSFSSIVEGTFQRGGDSRLRSQRGSGGTRAQASFLSCLPPKGEALGGSRNPLRPLGFQQ